MSSTVQSRQKLKSKCANAMPSYTSPYTSVTSVVNSHIDMKRTGLNECRITEPTDYPDLRKQLNDDQSTFYGPHQCVGCYKEIIKKAFEEGAEAYEVPVKDGDTFYKLHRCTHILFVKRLAGRLLTILDATFGHNQVQCKAIKDLVRKEISATISDIRQNEGDFSCESTSTLEQLAESL